MSAATCPACDATLPDRGFYCPKCLKQARCKACNETLERGALGCVFCGTRIGEGAPTAANGAANGVADHRAPNRLRFEETRSSRKLEADLTDDAVQSLSDPINAILAAGMMGEVRQRRSAMTGLGDNQVHTPDAQGLVREAELVMPPPTPVAVIMPSSAAGPALPSLEDEQLRSIFIEEDGKLILDETRLKGKGPLDSATRLTYLRLLFAYQFEDKKPVERQELLDLIETAKWLNTSTSSRLFKDNNDFIQTERGFVLRNSGRQKAQEYLKEVFDETIPQPVFEVSGSRKSGGVEKQDGEGKKAATRKGGKLQHPAPWIAEWKKRNILTKEAGFEILKNKTVVERAIFGMWAILQVAPEEGQVVTAGSIETFLFQVFAVKADRSSLARNLVSSETKDRVAKIDGSKFQLLPPGVTYAAQLANLSAPPVTEPPAAPPEPTERASL